MALIQSPLMGRLWESEIESPLRPREVANLAVDAEHAPDRPLDVWQSVLAEIITGDAFGVDRMDYLLRDSLHAGVAYGRFDHFRLIDTLRILRPVEGSGLDPEQPQLGVEVGGLQSAEALLMARYFIYTQVYLHRLRRIHDIQWLRGGTFPTDPERHLALTDAEVTAALLKAARSRRAPGHDPARRIIERDPFKPLWQWNPEDVQRNPNAGAVIARAVSEQFGEEAVRRDEYVSRFATNDFPVLQRDGKIVSAQTPSTVLRHLPVVTVDFVFVRPDIASQAHQWLANNRAGLLQAVPTEAEEE